MNGPRTVGEARPHVLEAIVSATRRAVEEKQQQCSVRDLERLAAERIPRAEAFLAALARANGYNVIAECKWRSPSHGLLRAEYDPEALASAYVSGGASALSVLTEPAFFDGALDHLTEVRSVVDVPLLRKDFIVSEYQLIETRAAGADAVLLIVAALSRRQLTCLLAEARDLGLAVLVEVHDSTELSLALEAGAQVVGINNRNLRTLSVNLDASRSLIAEVPTNVIAVAESDLKTGAELTALRRVGYDAFLIGESLITSDDPGLALAALLATTVELSRGGRGQKQAGLE